MLLITWNLRPTIKSPHAWNKLQHRVGDVCGPIEQMELYGSVETGWSRWNEYRRVYDGTENDRCNIGLWRCQMGLLYPSQFLQDVPISGTNAPRPDETSVGTPMCSDLQAWQVVFIGHAESHCVICGRKKKSVACKGFAQFAMNLLLQ